MAFPCHRCFSYRNVERAEGGRYLCEDCRSLLTEAEAERERQVAMSGRRPQVCAECDEIFVAARRWQRFCSPRCRLRAHRRAKAAQRVT
jgi:hypothetical protein